MARNQSGRHRPHRGHPGPNVLVSGDPGSVTGVSRDPQGGARDVATEGPSESGDLEAREFGVPQADIPGGVRHLVNAPTHVDSPAPYPLRPVDYHKEHGVEPRDWGDYVTPPTEAEHYPALRPAPEPQIHDAVPVYIEEHPQKRRVIRQTIAFNINIEQSGDEPTRICGLDPNRVEIMLMNEDTTNDIRISNSYAELAQAIGSAGNGALLPHAATSYQRIKSQGALFAQVQATTDAKLSVIIVTEVPETAGIE